MIKRRNFIKSVFFGAAALAAVPWGKFKPAFLNLIQHTSPHADKSLESSDGVPRKWVMVIDLAKCDGCQACTRACTAMHSIPFQQEWIKVYNVRDNENTAPYWFPRPCMQCDNPPCTKVCPVGATFKRKDGIVLIDQDMCIGCRYCMAACPYSARYFNWAEPEQTFEQLSQPYDMESNMKHRRGVVEKCTFCPHMLKEGKLPGCATACRMGAIYFGDELEDTVTNGLNETLQFSKLLAEASAFRFMEELGTKPRVYYLPPRNRKYPIPKVIKE